MTRARMYSWEVLAPTSLRASGVVTNEFLKIPIEDFRSAAWFVRSLPYGRNCDPGHALAVLAEGRGTCSTKHALVKRLAVEQGVDISLMIGVYEMTGANTPGVAAILAKYRLRAVPEAHCYLRMEAGRVDVTRVTDQHKLEPITFLYEEEIEAPQIGRYKQALHRRFISRWMLERDVRAYAMEDLWRIREECIAALRQ